MTLVRSASRTCVRSCLKKRLPKHLNDALKLSGNPTGTYCFTEVTFVHSKKASRGTKFGSGLHVCDHTKSYPTVGAHQKFLSISRQELNILPDTVIERKLFAPPDRHFYALVLKRIYQVRVKFSSQLLGPHLLKSVRNLRPETCNPYRGVTPK